MIATVDQDACIGCGLCPSVCPEVFRMEGDLADVAEEKIPEELTEVVEEAAENCPTEAILLS